MKLHAVWTGILYVFDLITLSPERSKPLPEAPLPAVPVSSVPTPVSEIPHKFDDDTPLPPIVGVPRREGAFECLYPDMTDFENCHGPDSRGCWLRHRITGEEYNINSDYDDPNEVPTGIVREFRMQISDMPISPDGVTMEHGKVFNRTYPGPWIEACWGDTIKVHITNNLRFNGTSIHFHGIRMLNNVQNDGVNGVTQCPIAPGDSFTYEFHATQYGSSWYHSHYSLQYGDGAVGPITIHGPATADFESDEAFKPLLLTDWNHRSVFEDWAVMLQTQSAPEMTNILLNGIGQFGPSTNPNRPKKYNITFNEGHTHFMRIINTAVDTAFIFTIDDHTLEVIEADFVPIVPYNTSKILVGIGQRYHVLVRKNENATDDNYWIRTIPARKCSKFYCGPDEQMGIVRYTNNTANPTTDPYVFGAFCADEPYESLVPKVPWTVGPPANIVQGATDGVIVDATNTSHSEFNVSLNRIGGPPYVPSAAIQRWDIHLAPFRINFSEPTVLNLDEETYPDYLSVVTANTDEDEDAWIWLVISAPAGIPPDGDRLFIPAAHPMHLHGHDFALLRQSENSWLEEKENITLDCSDEKIKCDNPPRRDVALLPAKGYIIIAFKADNPGVWLIHCHIAFHASSGLVLQIIENGDRIPDYFNGEKEAETKRVCSRWDEWFSDPLHHWDFQNPDHFQDDSGV